MTRHNLCTNPACKNDVTGWGGGSTPTRATGLTGFPDRTTGASYTSGTFMTGPVAAVTAGQTITFSIYARSNSFNVNSGTIYIQWDNASTVSTSYTLTAGVVTRVSITAAVPAGRTTAQIVLDGQNYASSSGDYSQVLYEVSGTADTYFDGDTTNASWDGADGNSASTLNTLVSADVSQTVTASSTVTAANAAPADVSQTATAASTVTGANSAPGAVTSTVTATVTAAAAWTATTVATDTTTATATVTATIAGETTATGSWYQLLDIQRENADFVRQFRSAPPAACPNDGEPLLTGPDGRLFCRADGWRPD